MDNLDKNKKKLILFSFWRIWEQENILTFEALPFITKNFTVEWKSVFKKICFWNLLTFKWGDDSKAYCLKENGPKNCQRNHHKNCQKKRKKLDRTTIWQIGFKKNVTLNYLIILAFNFGLHLVLILECVAVTSNDIVIWRKKWIQENIIHVLPQYCFSTVL